MNLQEAKAKYHALADIKALNAKLVKLQGFSDEKERFAESKAKKEITEINKRVKIAKAEVAKKQIIVNKAKLNLDSLTAKEPDPFEVVPSSRRKLLGVTSEYGEEVPDVEGDIDGGDTVKHHFAGMWEETGDEGADDDDERDR